MEHPSTAQISGKMVCHSSDAPSWRGCIDLPIPLKYSKNVLLNLRQVTYLVRSWFSLFFFSISCIILAVRFGSLSSWNIPLLGVIVSQYFGNSTDIYGYYGYSDYGYAILPIMAIDVISPKPVAFKQPHIITFPPPCFTVETMHSFWFGSIHAKHAGPHQGRTNLSWSHLSKE